MKRYPYLLKIIDWRVKCCNTPFTITELKNFSGMQTKDSAFARISDLRKVLHLLTVKVDLRLSKCNNETTYRLVRK